MNTYTATVGLCSKHNMPQIRPTYRYEYFCKYEDDKCLCQHLKF